MNLRVLFSVGTLMFMAFITTHAQPENVSTLKFGLGFTSSGFGSQDGLSQQIFGDAQNEGISEVRPFSNYDTRKGVLFEMGDYFYFNTGLPNYIGVGIDASYLSLFWARTENRGRFSNGDEFEFSTHYLTYSPRVGPLITYSPQQDLYLDFSFRWSPTVAGTMGSYGDETTEDGTTLQADDRLTGIGYGLARFNTGLYLRYNVLTLGFEWEFGGTDFATRSSAMSEWYSNDVRLNSLRFIFGFNFVKVPRR